MKGRIDLIKTYSKGKAVKLADNFKSTEFDCKGRGCCSYTLVDEKLVKHLQQIRNHFAAPVVINSGYRCFKHNNAVKGAAKSQHMKGKAADIVVKGVSPRQVAAYAEKIGADGIGTYATFTHIDTRGYAARWQVMEWHRLT